MSETKKNFVASFEAITICLSFEPGPCSVAHLTAVKMALMPKYASCMLRDRNIYIHTCINAILTAVKRVRLRLHGPDVKIVSVKLEKK